MSSVSGHVDAGALRLARSGRTQRATAWLESNALFIAAAAAVLVACLMSIPGGLTQDGWLALVAGRIVAQHGVPHHDYVTVMAHGVRWIDQQWLAQWALYELAQAGGLALFAVASVGLAGAAFLAATTASRTLGGRPAHVTATVLIAAAFYFIGAVSVRTQAFAFPLFVATLWLLAAEARTPTRRRVYLVFPLLILWANLHGSVVLGVGLGVLYGALLLAASARARGWRGLAHRRGLVFLIGAPLCLLATPYGITIVDYYRGTLFSSTFGKLLSEWRPVTTYTFLAVPFLLLVVGTIWAIGRSGRRTPAFDQLALGALALAGIFAVRNVTWFVLAFLMLVPATTSGLLRAGPAPPRRRRLNLAIAGAAIGVVAVMTVATFARPASWFERTYPARALDTVAAIVARHPDTKIFADVRFADWLVWHDPGLSGHIAYDTSFENLTGAQLTALADLGETVVPGTTPDTIGPYSVLVLDPSNRILDRILLARPGVRMIVRSGRVIIATKPAT